MPGEYTVGDPAFTTNSVAALSPQAGYTGATTNTGLLDVSGGGNLAIGEKVTLTFTMTFFPDFTKSPLTNQALASGDSPGNDDGTVDGNTTDMSDNGVEPDGDDDNNPDETDENDPTPLTIPVIGIAKSASALTDNNNGTFTTTYTLIVENLGNEILHDVQITDDLTAKFGTYNAAVGDVDMPGEYTVGDPTFTTNSVAALSPQAGYTGATTNTGLLDVSGGGNLAIGEKVTLTFTMTFFPDFTKSPLTNQALASGDSPGNDDGTVDGNTTDMSDNGVEPDGDDDNNPDETDENDPTPLTIPVIGIAKSASALTDNNNGTYTTTYTLIVENLGNEILHDVQITDDLTAKFGTYNAAVGDVDMPGEYTVGDPTFTTNSVAALSPQAGYTGATTNTGLLDVSGGGNLAIGEKVTLTFTMTFFPDFTKSPLTNQALASGDSPGNDDGTVDGNTTDMSDNGVEPDGDDDNNPDETDENDPTPLTIPVIGIAKSASALTDNNNGTYTTTYTLIVENLGNEILHDVQITDDLTAKFGTYNAAVGDVDMPGEYTVGDPTFTTNSVAALSPQAGYTGATTNTGLLDVSGGGNLAIGEKVTLTFTMTFFPDFTKSPLTNQALASGDSPGNDDGTVDGNTTDMSDNGVEPDGDDDNNPDETDENDPTPLTIPVIGIAKSASALTDNNNGTYTTTYTLIVENLGNEILHDVQITDDLTAKFGTYNAAVGDVDMPGEYTVGDPTFTTNSTAALSPQAGYTGSGVNTGLLDVSGGGNLAIGEKVTLTFTMTFFPDFTKSPLTNQALASGDSPGNDDGTVDGNTTDMSDNGVEPDGDDDNNPDETDENDPTPLTIPVIGIAKSASALTDNNNGTFTTTYTLIVENLGNEILHDVQITDDLTAKFGTYNAAVGDVDMPGEYTVGDPTFTTNSVAALSPQAGYTGSGVNTGLLDVSGGGNLAIGEKVTLTFTMTFFPDFTKSPLTNQALASGDSPGNDDGTVDGNTTDMSDNGVEPDGDDDNNPDETDENDPTPLIIPRIALVKTGIYSQFTNQIIYTFTATNTGNVPLTNISIKEKAFTGTGTLPVPTYVSSSSGSSETTMLVGGTSIYTATYNVTAADIAAGFVDNQATARADGPMGDTADPSDDVTDDSDDASILENDDTVVPLRCDLQITCAGNFEGAGCGQESLALSNFLPFSSESVAMLASEWSAEGISVTGTASGIRYTYRDEIIGSCPTKILRTYTLSADCGKLSCTRIFTFRDNTPPEVSGVPADATVACNEIPEVPNLQVSDNCGGAVRIDLREVPNYDACGGTLTRTWTITDFCGNRTTRMQTLTILPAPVPTVRITPAITDINVNCELPAPRTFTFTNGLSGKCLISGSVSSQDVLIDAVNGTYERIWDAGLDICGRPIPVLKQIIQVLPYVENLEVNTNARSPKDGVSTCDIFFGKETDTNNDGRFGASEWKQLSPELQATYNTEFGDIFCREADKRLAEAGQLIVAQQYQLMPQRCGDIKAIRRYRIYPIGGDETKFPWIEQNILIKYKANWTVKFPEDFVGDCSDDFPAPMIEVEAGFCDQVYWSYEETTFRGDGVCYKILRTYRLINECLYTPGQAVFKIPRRENGLNQVFGDSVQHIRAIAEIDGALIGNHGTIEYTQVLKIGSTKGPEIRVDSVDLCLISEGGTGSGGAEGCQTVTRTFNASASVCGKEDDHLFRFDWLIYENEELKGSGNGNSFDWEVLPQRSTGITYRVRWNVFDNCGNKSFVDKFYNFMDCKRPSPICLHGIAVELDTEGNAVTWASDTDHGSFDNCTDRDKLLIMMWHASVSDTPPTDIDSIKALPKLITFNCNYLGNQEVYLYVIDEEDNWDYCVSYYLVQDNMDVCKEDITENRRNVFSWRSYRRCQRR